MSTIFSQNKFLKILRKTHRSDFESTTELIEVKKNQQLTFSPGTYFPLSCVLAEETHLIDGKAMLCRLIGRDSFLVVNHRPTDTAYTAVIEPGFLARRQGIFTIEDLGSDPVLTEHALQLVWARSDIYSVNVCCAGTHPITSRIPRLLIQASGAFGPHRPIVLTHDELSRFVGARRETVTECLNRLAKNEILELGRGAIKINDHAALRAASCDCILEDEKTATFITKIIESIASRMTSDTTADLGTRPKIDDRANPSST